MKIKTVLELVIVDTSATGPFDIAWVIDKWPNTGARPWLDINHNDLFGTMIKLKRSLKESFLRNKAIIVIDIPIPLIETIW